IRSRTHLKNNSFALPPGDHDISLMRHPSIIIAALGFALISGAASAQLIPPGSSPFNPPLPAPLPPPRIEAPVVPQMDAPLTQNYASAPTPSFGDRVTTCLEDAAASGLGPNARATYSRACANR
ncbi:MAG: hypothetical protein QOC84_1670, partial [Bradyrhizobium sp.]|nr:hypothetical protein [Bradyrhizobium sp.]